MPRVLITDDLALGAADRFAARGLEVDVHLGLAKGQLVASIDRYDALAVRSATKVDAEVIAAGTRLRAIGRAGIGVDNIDVAAATARGIVVMNTPFGNNVSAAEHAIALLFAVARRIGEANASTQAGHWEKERFMGFELTGKTLGVVGCGNIGALVAERALGLRMRVIAFDPFLTPERAATLGVTSVGFEELLARADAITLHTPLTSDTRHLIDAAAIARMKPGAVLINAARGGLVDEGAVRAALDAGHLGGAGFDVFATEPARENVLFGARHFVATPHLGASTVEAQARSALQLADQLCDFLLEGRVVNAVHAPGAAGAATVSGAAGAATMNGPASPRDAAAPA